MQNYLNSTPKNFQNTLFLNTPKWLFISGPSHLAHAKKGKTILNQRGMVPGYLTPYLKTGQNLKNVAVLKTPST
jgi:hypothetical protein